MQKWEYKMVSFHFDVREVEISKLGALGWELVCIDQYDKMYFKRPVD